MPGNQHVWAGLSVLASFLEAGAGSGENYQVPLGVVGPAVFYLAGMSFLGAAARLLSTTVGSPWRSSLTGATQSYGRVAFWVQGTGVCCKTFLSKEILNALDSSSDPTSL